MVEIIAHRARYDNLKENPVDLRDFTQKYMDNNLASIQYCLSEGYSVEVDVNSGSYSESPFLGHDYRADDFQDLLDLGVDYNKLYLHAKTPQVMQHFIEFDVENMWFYNDKEDYAPIINTDGLIWANTFEFDTLLNSKKSNSVIHRMIIALNDVIITDKDKLKFLNRFYGICTDFPHLYRNLLKIYA